LESVEARRLGYKKNEFVYEEDIKLLKCNPHEDLQDKRVIDGGCSRHMTGNMSCPTYYEETNEGYVAIGGNPKGGKITGRGKFDGKVDEGFFVGYSLKSKAFRVFNNKTRIVEENLHIRFNKNTPNTAGSGQNWLLILMH
nr:ribonuclease H-like domain-containing protein [Tanacetum cinerariifolium]